MLGTANIVCVPDIGFPLNVIVIFVYPLDFAPFFIKQYQPTDTSPVKLNVGKEKPPIINKRPLSASVTAIVFADVRVNVCGKAQPLTVFAVMEDVVICLVVREVLFNTVNGENCPTVIVDTTRLVKACMFLAVVILLAVMVEVLNTLLFIVVAVNVAQLVILFPPMLIGVATVVTERVPVVTVAVRIVDANTVPPPDKRIVDAKIVEQF